MAGWDIRKIYLYLVSFATLMMMVIGTVLFLQAVVNIVYPNPLPGPYLSDVETRYKDMSKNNPAVSEEEVKKQIEAERAYEKKTQRYGQVKSMADSLILFTVALPVYLYHWKKIRNSET